MYVCMNTDSLLEPKISFTAQRVVLSTVLHHVFSEKSCLILRRSRLLAATPSLPSVCGRERPGPSENQARKSLERRPRNTNQRQSSKSELVEV